MTQLKNGSKKEILSRRCELQISNQLLTYDAIYSIFLKSRRKITIYCLLFYTKCEKEISRIYVSMLSLIFIDKLRLFFPLYKKAHLSIRFIHFFVLSGDKLPGGIYTGNVLHSSGLS